MSEFNITLSASLEEAALAAILNGGVEVALRLISEMPDSQQYELRKAAETLASLCKKP